MIYLTASNSGVVLHVLDVHGIWCECDFLSGAGILHLIHGEKVDRKLRNMQHILEAFVGEFNPSFVDEFDRRVVPHQNRKKFACIQKNNILLLRKTCDVMLLNIRSKHRERS
jgi:hypothetical protein